MTHHRWYIARSGSGTETFYHPYAGADPWVSDRDAAFRFDDKADAHHVAEQLAAVLGARVESVSDCPKAAQQREAQRQEMDARWHDPVACRNLYVPGVRARLARGMAPGEIEAEFAAVGNPDTEARKAGLKAAIASCLGEPRGALEGLAALVSKG